MKLAPDGFARGDAFQKLYTDRFLHRKVYAKSRESCSRVWILAPWAIDWASSSGEADPPSKVERVVLNALASKGPNASGRILQRAADGCSNGAKTRNKPGKNLRRKRLVPIALSRLRRIVHFNHERIRARSDCSQAHLRDKFAQTQSVRWIDYNRQMRFGL